MIILNDGCEKFFNIGIKTLSHKFVSNIKQMEIQNTPPGGRDRGKIFITGGTGFLGAYIIKELVEKGFSVRAIRRSKKLPFLFL